MILYNRLYNRVAVVTGSGKGIGRAIVKGLYEACCYVFSCEHTLDSSKDQKNDFLNNEDPCINKGELIRIQIDITRESDIKRLFEIINEKYGRVDILVNNAGITIPIGGDVYPKEDWFKTLDVNLNSAFFLCQSLLPLLKRSIYGASIINVSSIVSIVSGFSDNPAYIASKSALRGLTKSLAKDWAKYNIRVNNICPGYTRTKMTDGSFNDKDKYKKRVGRIPLGRFGKVDDIVGGVVFLGCSDESSYVTGIDLIIDGGFCMNGI